MTKEYLTAITLIILKHIQSGNRKKKDSTEWFCVGVKVKEGSVCVRVGFQGRSKLTWKVILGGMIYELYRHYYLVTLS